MLTKALLILIIVIIGAAAIAWLWAVLEAGSHADERTNHD